MKYSFCLPILLVLIITSCSTGWQNISEGNDEEGGSFTLALDRSDIHELDGIKTAWVRKTFEKPKSLKNGKSYQETFAYIAVKCKDKKYSILQIGMSNPGSNEFVHTINFSDGEDDIVWKDVPSDNLSQRLYKELCIWYESLF